MVRRSPAAALGALCAVSVLSACSGGAPAPTPTASPGVTSPTPGGTATATPAAPSASPTATPRLTLAACPTTPRRAADLAVLWRGGHPDDLAIGADGALWISDVNSQLVTRAVNGAATRTISGLGVPEGLVALPDGGLVAAEQARDRVTLVQPDGSRTVLLTLPRSGALLGVDGIAIDQAGQRLIVPDSPHGTVLSVPLSGGHATTLASGLGRVVGAAVDVDGSIWLAAEDSAPRGLLHLTAGGHVATVGNLAQLDDVVLLGGLLYATDLTGRSVHAIDTATGADRVIATGFSQPQGLAALPDGALAIADTARSLVQRLPACGG
jgi:sugar lactone lactonase YvrE